MLADMDQDLYMILKMSAATLLFVLASLILWKFWKKRENTLKLRIAVGVIFGLCLVVANHISVDYGALLLNVRDIGPLVAGLFFDPLSGVIAGLIGGVERFIIGEFFEIGYFTRYACSISAVLAGLLAAALNRWVYRREHPPVFQAFFLGAVMEVFHMYAVLITHRNNITSAFYTVQTASVPMIVFTAIGVALSTWLIRLDCGESRKPSQWKRAARQKPTLSASFERWLLLITLSILLVSFVFYQVLQYRTLMEETEVRLQVLLLQYEDVAGKSRSTDDFVSMLEKRTMEFRFQFFLIDEDNSVLYSDLPMDYGFTEEEMQMIRSHLEDRIIFSADGPVKGYLRDNNLLCAAGKVLGNKIFLIGIDRNSVTSDMSYQVRSYEKAFSDILLFTVLYVVISLLMKHLVVNKLSSVNNSLHRITSGNLEETVDVRSHMEYEELSNDINQTVTALKGYIDAAEKRMEEELKLAAAIQESALPRVFTFARKNFELYALMDPARQVGGDFYDFFFIDQDHLALVIADVSGKGIPAALFMMRSKTAIKNLARTGHSPAEMLMSVNNLLCEGNDAEMFVTVWIGIVDLRTGNVQCANAGHEYPMLMRSGEQYEVLKDRHGLVLAAMENVRFRQYEIQLSPGDRLFVYTDGVPEAINESEEQYGLDRLAEQLNLDHSVSQEQLLHNVRDDISRFAGSAEQFDDITMIGFNFFGPDDGPGEISAITDTTD